MTCVRLTAYCFICKNRSGQQPARNVSSSLEYMELVEHSARELYTMTENLLSLAHLDQNQLRTEEVVLAEVFQKMERQFAKIEGSTPISIHMEANDHYLNASPILLQMLLQNLVENGIKYNESTHKEIWLRVESASGSNNPISRGQWHWDSSGGP